MKENFLIIAASMVCLGVLVGVGGTLFVENAQQATRFASAGGVFAIGSIGMFMIGLITPK